MDDNRRCTATSQQSGSRCKKAAIRGGTVCQSHGGGAPAVKAAAAARLTRTAAENQVATLGLPVDIEPQRALLDEVHRAAGAVAWIAGIVAGLDEESVTFGVSKVVEGGPGGGSTERRAAVNVWVQLYGEERDRLTRAAKLAIDAGVSERLVTIEEEKGALLALLLNSIIDDPATGLGDSQRTALRSTAARHLRAVPAAS